MAYDVRIDTDVLNAATADRGIRASEVDANGDWPEIVNDVLSELPPQTFSVVSDAGLRMDMRVTVESSIGFGCDFCDISVTVALRHVGDQTDFVFVKALDTSAVTATDRAVSDPGVADAADDQARLRALLDWVIRTASGAVFGMERLAHAPTARLLDAVEPGGEQRFADLVALAGQNRRADIADPVESRLPRNAMHALVAYAEATCGAAKPVSTLLADLCGDLMHLLDAFGVDPEAQMLAAMSGYRATVAE